MIPETHYARTADGVHIAYATLGDGPIDFVFVGGFVFNLEQVWEGWPQADRFMRRVAEFARLLVFDRRGTGLSDHIMPSELALTLEARMDDIRAVMDAAGSTRAVIFGFEEAFALAAMFAATYPDRTAGLVTFGASARGTWTPDYPWADTDAEMEDWLIDVDRRWGSTGFAAEQAAFVWPGLDDPGWIADYAAWMRRSVSPGDAIALFRVDMATDVRDILPTIRVPALVVHRHDDRSLPVGGARYIAERIPGARLVELPGSNHAWVSPDQGDLLDELERFVRQLRAEEADFDRVLATVVVTDIVGSTDRIASLGDRAWGDLVERHHALVRGLLTRYRGVEVDTAGDGFLATFDGPARALRCGLAIVDAVRSLGLDVRVGVHTGEVEKIDGKVGGMAVHLGARIGAAAAAGDVLASSTVKDLVAGSGLTFEDAGEHRFKGVPDPWRLYRVVG